MKKISNESLITIVPAAGIGRRMQSSIPKQYIQIDGKSILEHTIFALRRHPLIEKIIIVIAKDDPYFAKTSLATDPNIDVVFGGKERADSVYAGLNAAQQNKIYQWVLVHDAARPLIQVEDIDNLICYCLSTNTTKLHKEFSGNIDNRELAGAILAVPLKETVKEVYSSKVSQTSSIETDELATTSKQEFEFYISKTVPRSSLFSAQTPQMFSLTSLKSSIETALENCVVVTDEASAVELSGKKVGIVVGRSSNIKVTEPDDLDFCAFYLNMYKHRLNTHKE